MVELLKRSILYIEPVDPVYWCGALRKCEGRILPCLRVRWYTCQYDVFQITTITPNCFFAPLYNTKYTQPTLNSNSLTYAFTVDTTVVANTCSLFLQSGKGGSLLWRNKMLKILVRGHIETERKLEKEKDRKMHNLAPVWIQKTCNEFELVLLTKYYCVVGSE